jgi:hypothetical protein
VEPVRVWKPYQSSMKQFSRMLSGSEFSRAKESKKSSSTFYPLLRFTWTY